MTSTRLLNKILITKIHVHASNINDRVSYSRKVQTSDPPSCIVNFKYVFIYTENKLQQQRA